MRARTSEGSFKRRTQASPNIVLALTCFGLGAVILAISMPHLKQGAVRICHCSDWTGWLIAVVFDLSQILAEVAALLAPGMKVEAKVRRITRAIILCSTLVSMALNVDAFLTDSASTTKALVSSWIAGVLLPLGVLAFCYLGSTFWLAGNVGSEKKSAKSSR